MIRILEENYDFPRLETGLPGGGGVADSSLEYSLRRVLVAIEAERGMREGLCLLVGVSVLLLVTRDMLSLKNSGYKNSHTCQKTRSDFVKLKT